MENPSSTDNSCERKEKEITEGKVHISVTQDSFDATVTRGPIDDMKNLIELDKERVKRTLNYVARAEKAIDDCRAALEKKSKMLDDSKEELQQFLLLGRDDIYSTLHQTVLEDSVLYFEESVSYQNEKLQLTKESLTFANESLKSAYAVLTARSKALDNQKRIIPEFDGSLSKL